MSNELSRLERRLVFSTVAVFALACCWHAYHDIVRKLAEPEPLVRVWWPHALIYCFSLLPAWAAITSFVVALEVVALRFFRARFQKFRRHTP